MKCSHLMCPESWPRMQKQFQPAKAQTAQPELSRAMPLCGIALLAAKPESGNYSVFAPAASLGDSLRQRYRAKGSVMCTNRLWVKQRDQWVGDPVIYTVDKDATSGDGTPPPTSVQLQRSSRNLEHATEVPSTVCRSCASS